MPSSTDPVVQIHEDGLFHVCKDDGRPDRVFGDEEGLLECLAEEMRGGATVLFGSSCDFPAEWGRPEFAVSLFIERLRDAVDGAPRP